MKLKITLLMLTTLGLSGCFMTASEKAHHQAVAMCGGPYPAEKTAWMFYDDCAASGLGFVDAMACGKRTRNAGCETTNACSAKGDALVAFADTLASQLQSGELTEPQAVKKWEKHKNKEAEAYSKLLAQDNAKAEECYQQAYPQFLGVETQRRSAIDQQFWQNMENSAPKQTHCTGTGSYVSCTTF